MAKRESPRGEGALSDDALPFDPTRKPDLEKPGPRVPLSKFEFAVKFLEQQGRCYLCNGRLERGKIIDEHDPPRETMPASICDNLEFRKLACRACAKVKTVSDQAVIAKGRRIRGEKGQRARRAKHGSKLKSNPKIQSRGFSKQEARLPLNDRPSRNPNSWNKPAGGLGFRKHPTMKRTVSGKVVPR